MNAVSSDFVPIPARERPVVFQLAGGSRDHYTSRAKFILFDMTNLRPCSQPAYSVLVLKTFHYRERLINERNN